MAKKSNKKNWIQDAIKRPGAFKKKAKQAGMSTSKFASKVTSKKSKGKYSERTRRQANLAQTLAKFQTGTPGSIYGTPTAPNDYGFTGAAQAQAALQQAQLQAKQLQDQKIADQKMMQEQENKDFAKTMATQGSKFVKDINAAKNLAQGTSNLRYLNNANIIGAGASLAGTAVRKLSDDDDDTRINFGEGLGGIMQGAGAGASFGSALGPVGTAAGALVGAGLSTYQMIKARNQARKDKVKEDEYRMNAAEQQRLLAEEAATGGIDMGYNIGSSMTNSYIPGQQMMAKGGLIKRADGSYSQRGLWDNIRANKGSGKKPTKEMLEQERKIKAQEKKKGGYIKPLPGGAVEFVGPKHDKGGIMLDANTEVEGGETMDQIKFARGGQIGDYIFSDYLKLNGKTFAQRHKEMLRNGASQSDVQQLAKMQEEVAEKENATENGPRGPQYIARMGGVRKYQTGPSPLNTPLMYGVNFGPSGDYIPAYDNLVGAQLNTERAFSFAKPENQHKNVEGGYNRTLDGTSEGLDYDPTTITEVGQDAIGAMMANNPWYDWTDFDHTNEEDVKKFQRAFNEKVPEDKRIEVDGKVGEQTSTAYIPYKDMEMPEDVPGGGGGDEGDGGGGNDDGGDEGEKETPEDPGTPPISLRENILLPWQAMGPLAALGSKYPQPEKVAPGTVANPNLARVNFNAERAVGNANTNATNKFIQSSNSGPAAIAAQMATTNAQRENNRQIANDEARVNKELFNQEAMAGMQASMFNVGNALQANQFNAQNQNMRNMMEYEKRMNAANQLGNVAAQYGMDQRAYRAEERMAEAGQISGEYTRQKYYEELARQSRNKRSPYYGMGDAQLRDTAARMTQNTGEWANQDALRADAMAYQRQLAEQQANQGEVKKRKGGKYISKLNKVRR